MTADDTLHQRIEDLTGQLHELRAEPGPHDTSRIGAIEREIDQAWDLLRQREAKRDAGEDPGTSHERPQNEVEGYLQ